MEITFLGTGAGMPSKERNVSSIALHLLQEENHIWLFDCGEATQHQILQTTIKPRKINNIFITHLHGDHIFGLPGLLSSRSFQGGEDQVTVYGPKGIKAFIETSLSISKTHLNYPLAIVEIADGSIIKEENFTIYVRELVHGIPSYGYRLVEEDSPGRLLVEKLKELGIPSGPLYGEIKNNEKVETAEFGTLYRKDFVGPDQPGKIITIMGDTRYNENFTSFVKDSDLLVHEATFNHDQAELAKQYFHSTTKQAATLAKESNVKQLIITHISSRYQYNDGRLLEQEAREIFPNTILANDFYHQKIE